MRKAAWNTHEDTQRWITKNVRRRIQEFLHRDNQDDNGCEETVFVQRLSSPLPLLWKRDVNLRVDLREWRSQVDHLYIIFYTLNHSFSLTLKKWGFHNFVDVISPLLKPSYCRYKALCSPWHILPISCVMFTRLYTSTLLFSGVYCFRS